MELIDTHCHLDFPVFDPDRGAILDACRARGVAAIVVPGVEAAGWAALLRLCAGRPGLYPALGLHPCFLERHRPEHLAQLEALAAAAQVVAIGEVGLDFWAGAATAETQLFYFDAQLEIARRLNLPLLLHVRKAHDRVLQRLRRRAPPRGGIVHAFSGSRQQAERYLELGFRLGIGGALTYPRAGRLRRTVAELPLTALVLETDAPDMPLCGYQGQRNRPDRLPEVLAVLVDLRPEGVEEIAAQLLANSRGLLGLSSGL